MTPNNIVERHYTGLWPLFDVVPSDVTHVTVDPCVKVLRETTFRKCHEIRVVKLPEGLEKIDPLAFCECTSLEEINIPNSVKEIGKGSFSFCKKLVHITLPEGLQFIGQGTFQGCSSLVSIVIPSTVETISDAAFLGCEKLVSVEIQEGVTKLGEKLFQDCKCLQQVSIPSTVRVLPAYIFKDCTSLNEIEFPDQLLTIKRNALSGCTIRQLRFPQGFKCIQTNSLSSCSDIFSIELPEKLEVIESLAFSSSTLNRLRNIATPTKCKLHQHTGFIPSIECQGAIPRKKNADTMKALKSRFDGLPIHRICYYQSYHAMEDTLGEIRKAMSPRWPRKRLNPTGGQQDCLGMTPLHILACSKIHHLDVYKFMIDKYPSNLITEDGWGDVPLLYALWGNMPNEIVQFLVQSQKNYFPNQNLDAKGMVMTLCNGNIPSVRIIYALDTLQAAFPGHNEEIWQEVLTDLSRFGVNDASAHISAEKFRVLLRHGLSCRLNRLSRKWRTVIEGSIDTFLEQTHKRTKELGIIYSKLALYEELSEAAVLLELTLKKAEVFLGLASNGAVIIIPRVLAYIG